MEGSLEATVPFQTHLVVHPVTFGLSSQGVTVVSEQRLLRATCSILREGMKVIEREELTDPRGGYV